MPGPSDTTAENTAAFPERVRRARERRGMTRAAAAARVGRSYEWWKAIETGRLRMPRLPMLVRMADVLDVSSLSDLTGDDRVTASSYCNVAHPALQRVKDALTSYALGVGDEEPETPEVLTARVRQAWQLWHGIGDHRTHVADVLPALLGDLQHAARAWDGTSRRRVLVQLAQAYHLTQLYLSFQPAPELVMLTGDRAMAAAQDADSPHAIAAAAWYMNHVYRDAGEAHEARVELAMLAAELLDKDRSEEDMALWGLLHLAAALSYAKVGEAGSADHYWDQADHAATKLGTPYAHPWLIFGRGMVDAYRLTIDNDLPRSGPAVRAAAGLSLEAMPSATRRGFHSIEQARAYSLAGEDVATVHFLTEANKLSPETARFNIFARSTVADLVESGATAIRPSARALAREWGVRAA
ncbi:helix-turn-helix domain-containing protein [Streptomyces sp. CBMA152]|uniref:helix-turn-helix domain-containing protein n=1 Tax=Streptomyces sp. CBMA152 TaxID=1896312 RepID=UPI0016611F75|nr:helix-turn-helix domain-containing protein [Streptomyces sp. CBMA152]MBD0742783.1 DNA-binding protein [Streptomyces sp. CBMA152]